MAIDNQLSAFMVHISVETTVNGVVFDHVDLQSMLF